MLSPVNYQKYNIYTKYDWGSKNVPFLQVALRELTTINLWPHP